LIILIQLLSVSTEDRSLYRELAARSSITGVIRFAHRK